MDFALETIFVGSMGTLTANIRHAMRESSDLIQNYYHRTSYYESNLRLNSL